MTKRLLDLPDGEYFDEPEDWVAFMKRAIDSRAVFPTFGVNLKYDYAGVDRRLADLYNALRATGADVAMADATLHVIETGTPAEMFAARVGPYDDAPRALERLLALLEHQLDSVREAKMIGSIFDSVFRLSPGNPRGLSVLRHGLADFSDSDCLYVALQHDLDWFLQHIPTYADAFDPVDWAHHAPRTRRRELLEALLQKDPRYLDRMVQDARVDRVGRSAPELVALIMSAHPVYAAALVART